MSVVVLVVEDEGRIRDLVRRYLERDGFEVLTTGSGAEALELAANVRPELAILDLGLPDVTGEEIARELAGTGTRILMLTARAGEDDRIHGLELGADDYVTKPFSPRELMLRVHAVLRRGQPEPGSDVRSFGDGALVIDEQRHEARVRGCEIGLTPTEWRLLIALAHTPGRVYSRYELINRVRGYEFEGYERTIDSHVKNLRHKIEQHPEAPEIIQTVLGVGYRLGLARDS